MQRLYFTRLSLYLDPRDKIAETIVMRRKQAINDTAYTTKKIFHCEGNDIWKTKWFFASYAYNLLSFIMSEK